MARRATRIQNRAGLFCNGVDSSVTVPADYIIPQTFSVAFWYKPVSITSNDRIVDQQDSGPEDGFTFNCATTGSPQISFTIRNGAVTEANVISRTIKKGEWNFVTGTFTTNSTILYVNGVSTGNPDTACAMTAPTNQLTIGKRSGGSNFAKGFLDEFMVFSKVLSVSEIGELYDGSRDPLQIGSCDVWYKFDELSGTNIVDYSGNARHGTRAGAAGSAFFTEPGIRFTLNNKSTQALNFAKLTTGIVTIADTARLRPETTSLFTWAAWVYLFNTNENVLPRICEKAPQFFCLMGDQTNARCNQLALEISNSDDTTTEYWGSTRLQSNRWYHVATTFDGSSTGVCQHYVNGELEAMTTLLGPYAQIKSTTGSDLKIGNRNANDRNFSGLLSDFRMHNVVLTQDEIRRVMTGDTVGNGLVGKWNIDEGTGSATADSSGFSQTGTITAATWEDVVVVRSTT